MTRLDDDLQGIIQKLTNNSMSANSSKFQLIFSGVKGRNELCLNMRGQWIPKSEHVKLLGLKNDNTRKSRP